MSDEEKQEGKCHLWLDRIIIVGVLATIGFVFINRDKDWTGFVETQTTTTTIEIKEDNQGKIEIAPISKQKRSGKTLWDWLELLAVPILTFAVFYVGYQFDKRERELDKNNLLEEAIKDYLKSMADILLNKKLRKELFLYKELKSLDNEDNDNSVFGVARTLTITILRRLQGNREHQERIIAFLKDAKLFKFILRKAHLSRINLSEAYLRTDLQGAYLTGADLQGAYLTGADLQGANLQGADLQGADLQGANLQKAYYTDRDAPKEVCSRVYLKHPCPTKFPNNFDPESHNMIPITDLNQLEKILVNRLLETTFQKLCWCFVTITQMWTVDTLL